jgi:hypothetical protein
VSLAGFALVGLRALRRALPPAAWDALLFGAVLIGLVVSAAFADQIDHAVRAPFAVAGGP